MTIDELKSKVLKEFDDLFSHLPKDTKDIHFDDWVSLSSELADYSLHLERCYKIITAYAEYSINQADNGSV